MEELIMNKKIMALLFVGIFTLTISANAQIYRFGLNGAGMTMFGDFAETDWNNNGAAYAEFGAAGNFYFTYYPQNNFGISFRWGYAEYDRDEDLYQKDFKTALGITDDNYDMQTWAGSFSSSFQLGVSYRYDLSKSFEIEPYLYLGFMVYASPYEQVTWLDNSATFIHKRYTTGSVGFNYTPGVNFQWNVSKHFGINLLMEYTGASLSSTDEESITYSHDTFAKNTVSKQYAIQAFNFGLGLTYSFGEGLAK
jgi:hypothetical protein